MASLCAVMLFAAHAHAGIINRARDHDVIVVALCVRATPNCCGLL